ncbi:MAG: protoheme IX farnesyltransferase [Candidatus Omnitrophica bacterium]|nr:protoheme IX farnesyltransferase [Candidatus Omnitrophota bacterium]
MSARGIVRAYLGLTKPRLTALALVTAGVGYALAARPVFDWGRLAAMLTGAALAGGGASALNQWWERDADALMARTKSRPLPSGRLAPSSALVFGLVTSVLGCAWLWFAVNHLTAGLAVLTVVSYVLVYTPMKRQTSLCTLAGAIPGALPPLIGWAAAHGTLPLAAWLVGAIVFLWQLPHFLAIAWVYREEYARAGFRMLPVVEPDGLSTARQMVLYAAALMVTSLLPSVYGLAGLWYFLGALVAGIWLCAVTISAARTRSPAVATRLFLTSVGYLPILLALLVADRG